MWRDVCFAHDVPPNNCSFCAVSWLQRPPFRSVCSRATTRKEKPKEEREKFVQSV